MSQQRGKRCFWKNKNWLHLRMYIGESLGLIRLDWVNKTGLEKVVAALTRKIREYREMANKRIEGGTRMKLTNMRKGAMAARRRFQRVTDDDLRASHKIDYKRAQARLKRKAAEANNMETVPRKKGPRFSNWHTFQIHERNKL